MSRKRKELPLLKDVAITGVAAEGKSIAKVAWNGDEERKIVIFIPYGAPGDIADIKIDRKKNSYAEGHIERLIRPAEQRVAPRCEHFGVCGGCKWQHLPYEEQLRHKQKQVEDALRRIGGLELPMISPIKGSAMQYRYRNKMEYTFSDKKWRTWEEVRSGTDFTDSANALGFHIPGAFDKVLHIKECHLQDAIGDRIRNAIYDYAETRKLTFYNIKENRGLLRTLMIRISSTGEIMICISFGEDNHKEIEGLMQYLAVEFPEITSLLWVVNTKLNDTIGDLEIHVYRGREYIEERMENLAFRVNAKSFYQTNSAQAFELYKVAREFAGLTEPGDKLVYDLYTGAGTIANFVARNARKVIGIEYVEEAIADARLNSKVNGIENTEFFAGDMKNVLTEEFLQRHGRPDVMIIDPPRAGMHEDVVKVILQSSPERIVYVSCNPATQARDLAMMNEAYVIERVQPVDMFPHTHHVENVVSLRLRH